MCWLSISLCCSLVAAADEKESIDLTVPVDAERLTQIEYQVSIDGKLSTPGTSPGTRLDLSSQGRFQFLQREFEPAHPGASGLRAIRQFDQAESSTVVNRDFRTEVQLPRAHRRMQVYGSDGSLIHLSPTVRLTRKHVDLLQLPCDPLAVKGLLPTRSLESSDEQWNSDAWVIPLLIGLDGVISQEVTCSVKELSATKAVIAFAGKAEGAVSGASVSATLDGQLTLDRENSMVQKLTATLAETRSPGVVSPGLEISVQIEWTQRPSGSESTLPTSMPMESPSDSRLLLTLATPWQVSLLHDRDWHLFHETSDLLMLRRLVNGALVGQCNLAPARTMAEGEFTADQEFRSEVQTTHAARGGQLSESEVSESERGLRMHHIRVTSKTQPPEGSELKPEVVYWDHYLCSFKSGQQYKLIFTHTESDDELFGEADQALLETLVLRQSPPKLRLPR